MSRDQIFALDVVLAGISLLAVAAYVVFKAVVRIYALRNLEDQERAHKASSLINTARKMSDPFFLGFNGATVIAIIGFNERLGNLLAGAPWMIPAVIAVFGGGILDKAVLVKQAQRKINRRNRRKEENG